MFLPSHPHRTCHLATAVPDFHLWRKKDPAVLAEGPEAKMLVSDLAESYEGWNDALARRWRFNFTQVLRDEAAWGPGRTNPTAVHTPLPGG